MEGSQGEGGAFEYSRYSLKTRNEAPYLLIQRFGCERRSVDCAFNVCSREGLCVDLTEPYKIVNER